MKNKNTKSKPLKFIVITLFPDFIKNLKDYSIIGRAIKNKKIELKTINLRDFGLGPYHQVDDKPYGGGPGMLFRVDVVAPAIKAAKKMSGQDSKIFILTPDGKTFDQKTAQRLSKISNIILVCGHYEGFDKRIEKYVDGKISVGNYVLSGGEIPAMTVIDTVSRLIPGVIKKISLQEESFCTKKVNRKNLKSGLENLSKNYEYPQYTRPENYEGKKVPKILLSGNPKKIKEWQIFEF